MLPDPLSHPGLHIASGSVVLTPTCPFADNHLEGVSRHDQVAAGFVNAFVGLIAQEKPVVLIVNGEPLGDAIDRFLQQLAGALGRKLVRLARTDVNKTAHHAQRLALGVAFNHITPVFHPHQLAVLQAHAMLALVAPATGQGHLQPGHHLRPIVRVKQGGKIFQRML